MKAHNPRRHDLLLLIFKDVMCKTIIKEKNNKIKDESEFKNES